MDIHRTLPQSSDAEMGVLSSFLIAPNTVGLLCQDKNITREHFHVPAHGTIYNVLMEFWRDNEPIDVITLTQTLRDRKILAQVGGEAFVTDIFIFLPTAANVDHYIEIIQDKITLREIIRVCTEYGARAYDEQEPEEIPKLLSGIQDGVLRIMRIQDGQKTRSRSMRELVQIVTEQFEADLEGTGDIDMPTGIKDLDEYFNGFVAPEVTFIPGKPSEGKTALSLNIAEELAIKRRKRVGIISMEMGDIQLTKRLIGSVGWLDLLKIKRSRMMSDHERGKWVEAAKKVAEAPIYIRDDGQLSIAEISAQFTAWKARSGLDIGIIDHAQLIRGDGKTSNRTEEMEKISRALKPMAKRLGIPLLVLSQVTDTSTTATQSLKMKNSAALHEDADNVLLINRDDNGERWITISKQRDGARNKSVPVTFIEPLGRFTSKAHEDDSQPDLPTGKKPRK